MPNTEVKTLTNIVDKVRKQARNILRAKKINSIKTRLVDLTIKLNKLPRNVKSAEKSVAIAEYKLSKLDEADPDYDRKKEENEENVKACQNDLENVKKAIENQTKETQEKIDKATQGILDWETGESKVNMNELTELADKLLLGEIN